MIEARTRVALWEPFSARTAPSRLNPLSSAAFITEVRFSKKSSIILAWPIFYQRVLRADVMPNSVPVDTRVVMVVLPIEPVILQRINPRETLTLHIAGKRTTVKSPLT